MAQCSLAQGFFAKVVVEGPAGSLVHQLKGWQAEDESLRWETRRLLPALGFTESKFSPLYLQVGKSHDSVAALLRRLNMEEGRHVGRSRQSLRCRHASDVEVASADQEFWVSTEAMWLAALDWETSRRRLRDKQTGQAFMVGLLDSVVGADVAGSVDVGKLDVELRTLCDEAPAGEAPAWCSHVQEFMEAHQEAVHGIACPKQRVLGGLRCAMKWVGCPTVAGQARTQVALLAAHIKQRAHLFADTDWVTTRRAVLAAPSGKNRRSDPHTKQWVLEAAFAEKKAQSVQEASVQANVAKSTAASWRLACLSELRASSWLHFEEVQSFSLTVDAARLGKPAREFLFGHLSALDSDKSAHIAVPPQALKDFHPRRYAKGGLELTAEQADSVSAALRQQLLKEEGAEVRRKAKLHDTYLKRVGQNRRSNEDWCKALDAALYQVTGKGLSRFLAALRCGALSAGQKRSLEPSEEGEQELGHSKRRAMISGVYGERYAELQSDRHADFPVLHLCLDAGPTGAPAVVHALAHGLRVTANFDVLHGVACCISEGVSSSGLMLARLQGAVLCRLRRGPFAPGGGNHGVLRSAAESYFRLRSIDCVVFQLCYEDLLGCSGIRQDDPQSEECQLAVWEWAKEVALYNATEGENTKLSRWWSWEGSMRKQLQTWPVLLVVLAWLGFERGWWKSANESPLLRRCQQPEVGDAPLPGQPEEPR